MLVSFSMSITLGCHGHHHDHESHSHQDEHTTVHAHGDTPVVVTTLWSESYELFFEHPPAVAGKPVSFLLHLTTLPEFRALEGGEATLVLSGPERLEGVVKTPMRPGIFELTVTPQKPGVYRGWLSVAGERPGKVDGVELEVFETEDRARASVTEAEEGMPIEFLKEQQWGTPFGTAAVTTRSVLPSVVVTGKVTTPPGGQAVVGAPVIGRLVSPAGGLPRPGSMVKRGQLLALLSPAPSSPESAARMRLSVAQAQARVDAAGLAFERAERLIRDEAISKREFEEARREKTVALEALAAAQSSEALYSGARDARGPGSWRLSSPIDGTLVEVSAMPGATVSPGETLFRIVDTRELWLVARVPEQDVPRLEPQRDASFQIAGLDTWTPIRLGGESPSAILVTVGSTVAPDSRTVDVIYALAGQDEAIRVGATASVRVPVGRATQGLAVQRSALVDQDGRAVVYVQIEGEHFEERNIRTGARDGNWVAVTDGLQKGERVVTRGAHLVRLAGRSSGDVSHGHVH